MNMKRSILLCIAFLSCALAQQGSYGDESYYHQDDSGRDDLYANYAAKQNDKKAAVGWPKVLAAGMVGGYIIGAKSRKKSSAPKLRFKVKRRVECKISATEWATGTIVGLWNEPSPGQWVPYQIRLDDGQVIFAPTDNDMIIRAAK